MSVSRPAREYNVVAYNNDGDIQSERTGEFVWPLLTELAKEITAESREAHAGELRVSITWQIVRSTEPRRNGPLFARDPHDPDDHDDDCDAHLTSDSDDCTCEPRE